METKGQTMPLEIRVNCYWIHGALFTVSVSTTTRKVVEELASYRCEEVDTVGKLYSTLGVLGGRFACT